LLGPSWFRRVISNSFAAARLRLMQAPAQIDEQP
jgi:hypothetical protein